MMFEAATIITAPETVEIDGTRVRRAVARLEPFGREVNAVMLGQALGSRLPYPTRGSRVLLGMAGGGSGYILGVFGTAPTLGDAYLAPSADDGEVYLGPADTFEPIMLHPKASAELVNLQSQLDAVVTAVAGLMNAVAPGTGTTFQVTTIGGIKAGLPGGVTGGHAADRVNAAKGA